MPRLRILAGPNPNNLQDITDLVNTQKPFSINSDDFEGQVVTNIKEFTGPDGVARGSDYFDRADRSDITWSLQLQGMYRFV